MLARVQSFLLTGIDAHPCEVEADLAEEGLSKETIVGLPDAAVKESLERVRSAIGNAGYAFPFGRLLVNLAPADVRKEGPVYDLPIAVGLLIADGVVHTRAASQLRSGQHTDQYADQHVGLDHRAYLFAGELALDGRVRPIKGAIAAADLAKRRGLRGVIVPQANAAEAAVVPGIDVLGVGSLAEVVGLLNGHLLAEPHPRVDIEGLLDEASASLDFAEVRGQEAVKRGITVAAAGGHNLLMLGPAGTGKTMMAKALPGILPPLTPEEAIEITRVYSAVGRLAGGHQTGAHAGAPVGDQPAATLDETASLITTRPVRSPHHTASSSAVIGGGIVPGPGEISLAHRGILFLDELPEFPRAVLDTLRQPLEDGCVTICRAHSAATFPARFMLVAAMNPTAKGDMPDTHAGQRAMERYLAKLSRPLLDRIDIHMEAPAVPWEQLANEPRGTSSAQMRERVLRAREHQHHRQGALLNSELTGNQLDELAPMEAGAKALLGQAMTELKLSARAYDKIRRVSRTIADFDGREELTVGHIAEAVQYRLLDRAS